MICYIIILLTYYRFTNLTDKIKQYEVQESKSEENRTLEKKVISNTVKPATKYDFKLEKEINFKKHKLVLVECVQLFIDVPFLPFFLAVLIFSGWHFKSMINDLKLKKGRKLIVNYFVLGIIDYIGAILLIFCFLIFWRWHYTLPTYYRILTGQQKKIYLLNDENKSSPLNVIFQEKNVMIKIKILTPILFVEILKDIFLFFPFLIFGVLTM